MKATHHNGCGFLRLRAILAILAVAPLLASHAADSDRGGISRDDLNGALRAQQEKMNVALVAGTWKNADLRMSMTFSETGDFKLERERNGKTNVEKGLYKVVARGDGVLVSVFFSAGKDFFVVTPLSTDRAKWQELKSPDDKPDPQKSIVWTRVEGAPESGESSPHPPNAKGKELFDLQTPANLIGRWKSVGSDGVVTTMSFSEGGGFDYAKEKDGRRDDVVKATYTAQSATGGLVVTLTDGTDKAYYGVAFLSKDRCFKQSLKSPEDRIDPDKGGIILNRVP